MLIILGATARFSHPGGQTIAGTRTQEFADTKKCRPHRRHVRYEDVPWHSLRFIRRLYHHRGSETE